MGGPAHFPEHSSTLTVNRLPLPTLNPPSSDAPMSTPSPSAPSIASRLGDWLDPLLVKEVRQALSTRIFATAFILLQTAMGLVLLVGTAAQDDASMVLGCALVILFCVAFPLRAQYSVYDDFKRENLDLVQLTDTSGPHLIRSKVTAQLAVMLVFAVTLLPWFTARYFGGGVEILADLCGFATWLLLGIWITAAACIAAVFRSILVRIATTLAILGLGWLLCSIAVEMSEAMARNRDEFAPLVVLAICGGLFLIYLPTLVQAWLVAASCLEINRERLELRIRLCTLPALLVPASLPLFMDHELVLIPALLTTAASVIFILHASQLGDTTQPRSVRTWARWPWPLRIAARTVFAPTWSSGLFCAATLSALGLAYLWAVIAMELGPHGMIITEIFRCAVLAATVAVQQTLIATLLSRFTRNRLHIVAWLFIVAVLDITCAIMAGNLHSTMGIDLLYYLSIAPGCGIFLIDSTYRESFLPIYILSQLAWTALAFLTAAIGLRRHAPALRKTEEAAREKGFTVQISGSNEPAPHP